MKQITLLTLLILTQVAQAQQPAVKIYLPREVQVSGKTLQLGQLALVRCDDEQVVQKASALAMGRTPFSKETIVIERQTILARLGSAGIDTSKVEFSGSDNTSVTPREQSLSAERLVQAGAKFLEKNNLPPSGSIWRIVKEPGELTLDQIGEVELTVTALKHPVKDQLCLEVRVLQGESLLAKVEMLYRLAFITQQALATRDLPAGTILKPEDFAVETVTADSRPASQWNSPLGMQTLAAIQAAAAISPGQVRLPKLEVLVRRDQRVKMVVEGAGFSIAGIGQAMENGKAGDLIKVLNVDSQQVVVCRVSPEGIAKPVFNEGKQ